MPRRLHRVLPAAALAAAACCRTDVAADPATGKASTEPPTVAGPAAAGLPAKGRAVADFKVDAIYTNDSGGLVGTKWVHRVHGMPVTVLRIQSVPQVFLAFHTPPVSDRGEPHTGEHLLLGKGRKGKALSLEQDMSLVESTAWTAQTDVCYSWGCAAGKETFYRSVEQYLDALLLPDYTDEEIRREVCHIGPVKDEATGKLSLDEKGTIYQEMVSSYEKRWLIFDEVGKRLWGKDHPHTWSNGGEPSAVRTCEPRHVNEFHAAHYKFGPGTQMIVSLPEAVPEEEFLARLSSQMAAVEAKPGMKGRGREVQPIPPARPSDDHSPVILLYPNANEDDSGMAVVQWKPVPKPPQATRVLGEILMSALASGDGATLYKRLMERATREVPLDAAAMWGSFDVNKVDAVPGVGFDGLPARNASPERLRDLVRVIRDEIGRVSALREGSPELAAFNEKALVKLTEREKGLKRQIDAPPLFGHRSAGGFWLDHLRLLDESKYFARPVTLAPVFALIRAELGRGRNPWTKAVCDLGLDGEPYVGASVPSKAELEWRTAAKAERIRGYVADVAKSAGGDTEKALAAFAAAYDAKTAELAEMEKAVPKPHLVPDVPLTPDPSIRLEPVEAGGVAGFRGVFDTMSFVETSVSFRADAVGDELSWLAILPQFLTDAGIEIDGQTMPYDVAAECRAKEIHALSASWSMRPSKGRRELRITASGPDLREGSRAVDWIELCLGNAWLDLRNLPRLRDVVAQEIQATRGRLGGAEESWVHDPADAVRWQRDPVYLATSSIHARLFLLARCEWRLMDAPAGEDAATVHRQLDVIAKLGASGGDAKAVADGIGTFIETWRKSDSPANAKWVVPVAERIREMVGDMAPSTIEKDLSTLVRTCKADLAEEPGAALASVRKLRDRICDRGRARFTLTGSRAHTDAMLPRVFALFARMVRRVPSSPAERATRLITPLQSDAPGWVDLRSLDHDPHEERPRHYGLVHGAGTTGVFILSAQAGGYESLDEAELTSELASRVFGGGGPHGFFMQTWGAGLAYSNGLRVRTDEGRVHYYAERCPDLVQTMTFVSGLVKGAAALDDPYLAEYSVAGAVTWSRESDEFEDRTRAAADDIADGDTPERIAAWRRANLDLLAKPGLWPAIQARIQPTTARVIPGLGAKSRDVPAALRVTIAPEPMLARWDAYVKEHDAPDEKVVRLYGRDFWMTD